MPRLILTLGAGAQAADVGNQALTLDGVMDATPARQLNGVVVNVSSVTRRRREELANLPGVTGVWDDIQAIPQVASGGDVQDF